MRNRFLAYLPRFSKYQLKIKIIKKRGEMVLEIAGEKFSSLSIDYSTVINETIETNICVRLVNKLHAYNSHNVHAYNLFRRIKNKFAGGNHKIHKLLNFRKHTHERLYVDNNKNAYGDGYIICCDRNGRKKIKLSNQKTMRMFFGYDGIIYNNLLIYSCEKCRMITVVNHDNINRFSESYHQNNTIIENGLSRDQEKIVGHYRFAIILEN